ncbi:hypothetical protein JHK82_017880 [Glycine max]|nr:hypothetical protein JHK82_017880 [Glycine max]
MDFLYTLLSLIAFSFLGIFLVFCFILLSTILGKSIGDPDYAPVKGTVFNQLLYFNTLHDYQAQVAKTNPTFRLLAPDQSELYTADPRNVEHILKTNFGKYSKGKYNQDIVTDLFGEGIFAVDGDKWRQQRKLASFEFSTRVLRDFSCSVFRRNAAKLVRVISEFLHQGHTNEMHFGLHIQSWVWNRIELLGWIEQRGSEFMKAFDESNALIYWRYVDPFWRLKRMSKRTRFLIESKKDQKTMTDQYLRDIILNFMIAGKGTSANTLSWFFYMLCKNPLIEEKIVQEVRDVTCSCSHESEPNIEEFVAKITDDTLDKMHYLHAALTETLRLYPAVPADGRTAEAHDILPDGHKLKKGDGVYYLAYGWTKYLLREGLCIQANENSSNGSCWFLQV